MPQDDLRRVLTRRQQEVLEYLESCEHPPSYRDICKEFGVTINSVTGYLKALERKGFIRRRGRGQSRSIVVIPVWWRVHEAVQMLAQWMEATGQITTAEEAISVFSSPQLFADQWKAFCRANPETAEKLYDQNQFRGAVA